VVLLIDNYDSFTWNLAHRLGELGAQVKVIRNDAITVPEIERMAPERLVISPGPGRPESAGVTVEALRRFVGHLPVLGVCLGHQALVERYGGGLEQDPVPVHGRASAVHHDGSRLYRALPNPFAAGRYHSLRAKRETLPAELVLDAWTEDGLVMGVRHRELPRHGVQFHPESILSPQGTALLAAFLALVRERQ